MLLVATKWAFVLAVLFLIGPAVSEPLRHLHDANGGRGLTLLTAKPLLGGLSAGLFVLAVAGVVGVIAARFLTLGIGYATAGFVVGWGAWRTGTADALIRRAADGPLYIVAFEALLLAFFGVLITALMGRAAAKHQPGAAASKTTGLLGLAVRSEQQGPHTPALIMALVAGVAACAFAAWFVAISPLKGQAVAAAAAGGLLAGFVGQMAANSQRASITPIVPVLAVMVVGVASPVLAAMLYGDGITQKMYAGQMIPLARVLPLDWLAGALLGAPVGLGWSGVVLDERAREHPVPAA